MTSLAKRRRAYVRKDLRRHGASKKRIRRVTKQIRNTRVTRPGFKTVPRSRGGRKHKK